jgi:phage terminase large subunit
MKTEERKFSELSGFFDKQLEACKVSDEHQYFLYGGSRGPGKSYWLRWNCLRLLLKYGAGGLPGVRGGLFCNTYPELRDRQITKIAAEFPQWMGSLKETKEDGLGYHLKPAYGGGVILLRNLDDPTKYRSSEFGFIADDESTLHDLATFNILRGSLRWPGIEQPRYMAATNPGGLGHLWVRSYWIDGHFPDEMEPIRDRFAFVKALPDDNPHLTPDYWEMLDTLPSDLARAWRWGDWDVFEGQFFGDLRRETHGFTGEWPSSGRIIRSMDYGEAAPAAVYWATVDHDGDVWVYRELYGPGMQYYPLKVRIRDLSVDGKGKAEHCGPLYASPDIFAKSKGTGVVGSEVFNSNRAEYGGFSLPVVAADNNRIEGWRHMKYWVAEKRLHVHLDNCPHFWRTVPACVYDPTHAEDMDDKCEDHAAESMRYMLMSRPRPNPRKVEPIPIYSQAWFDKHRKAREG